MKRKIQVVVVFMLLFTSNTFGQYWLSNGSLNNGGLGNNLGTFNNYPINIYTSGARRAQFTTGQALTSFSGNFGDGLRILPPPGSYGNLDLFTSNTNGIGETHIVFGGSGQSWILVLIIGTTTPLFLKLYKKNRALNVSNAL